MCDVGKYWFPCISRLTRGFLASAPLKTNDGSKMGITRAGLTVTLSPNTNRVSKHSQKSISSPRYNNVSPCGIRIQPPDGS